MSNPPTIRVQPEDFDIGVEFAALGRDRADIGGLGCFVGTVRDTSKGRKIVSMTLEHYPAMTERAMARIAAERSQREVVDRLDTALTELADGNLTYRISDPMAEDYERLRVAFNRTMEVLGQTLIQVGETSQSVSCGANEIHAAAGDLAQRTE